MDIPEHWMWANGETNRPDGRTVEFGVWGWSSESLAGARRCAEERIRRLAERIARGEGFPERYLYGTRPVREEVLGNLGGSPDRPDGVLTRNPYGAEVLNTRELLFLDVDAPRPPVGARIGRHLVRMTGRLLGRERPEPGDEALVRLRETLATRASGTTFRIYRTAAGLRALAVDRPFDPGGDEAAELMEATGTDPRFRHLCRVQESFRARLTPKPWRCGWKAPPTKFPREDAEADDRFAHWLHGYEAASEGFATCRYLETVGSGRVMGPFELLLDVHDGTSRAMEDLPLA